MSLPKQFTYTCPKPYDRHEYRVYFRDGKYQTFEDYVEMTKFWWMYCSLGTISHVVIVDKVQKKAVAKGF